MKEATSKAIRPILVSTLELSGDEYASWLIKQYKKKDPLTPFIGLGGDCAKKSGMTLKAHFKNNASMAFVDTFKKRHFFKRLFYTLVDCLDNDNPQVLILIDSSGFNLRLAKEAYLRKIPVLYLIPPKVWAWATWRIKRIRRYCDQLACIYDFETVFFNQNKITAVTIQHPRNDYLKPQKNYSFLKFAICPGSRPGEIRDMLPIMLEAAKLIQLNQPKAHFFIIVSSTRQLDMIKNIAKEFSDIRLSIIDDNQKAHLADAHVALAASGTLTYELMLLTTAMIVVYKTRNKISYHLIKNYLYQPQWVSLPNLMANRTVVPELIQHDATAENIAQNTLLLVNEPKRRDTMVNQLLVLRDTTQSISNVNLGDWLYAFLNR